jgi:hypothetical protein
MPVMGLTAILRVFVRVCVAGCWTGEVRISAFAVMGQAKLALDVRFDWLAKPSLFGDCWARLRLSNGMGWDGERVSTTIYLGYHFLLEQGTFR